MSFNERLWILFGCVLELGVLMGAPMWPDQIKELMNQMNQATLIYVLPSKDLKPAMTGLI